MNEIVEAVSDESYRRNGNVARLPKAVRERINRMIEDGVTYKEIIARLGDEGTGLSASNLSRWKDGGYKDWQLEQAFVAQVRTRQEPASDLSVNFDATQISHAALQLGTLQIFEALRQLQTKQNGKGTVVTVADAETGTEPRGETEGEGGTESGGARAAEKRSRLDCLLGGDTAAFVRLLNALARASRETMLLQKYQQACAQARAALKEILNPKRKLSESETRAIVRNVDQLFGLNFAYETETEGESELPAEHGAEQGSIPNSRESARPSAPLEEQPSSEAPAVLSE